MIGVNEESTDATLQRGGLFIKKPAGRSRRLSFTRLQNERQYNLSSLI
ncbi:MAG: hypothetical protein LBK82_17280 [Planctomycetaceae bacterium]|nr:hypothetical protein [Planctomycetaceae bacterium]